MSSPPAEGLKSPNPLPLWLNKLQFTQNFLTATGTWANVNTDILQVLVFREADITTGILKTFMQSPAPLGVSVGLHPRNQSIIALALSLDTRCLIIQFADPVFDRQGRTEHRADHNPEIRLKIAGVLQRPAGFYAFDLAPIALALYSELDIRVTGGVDFQSAFPDERLAPFDAMRAITGTDSAVKLIKRNISDAFDDLTYDPKSKLYQVHCNFIAGRAWISQFLPAFENAMELFDKAPRVDTMVLTSNQLDLVAKMSRDATRLQYLKPTETEHAVTPTSDGLGGFTLESGIYKNKVRRDQNVRINIQNNNGSFSMPASTGNVTGRNASLNLSRSLNDSTNQITGKVISTGRDGPTMADKAKNANVLRILQGQHHLLTDNPWIMNLWAPPGGTMAWPGPEECTTRSKRRRIKVPIDSERPLNTSQICAVEHMLSLSDEDRMILIRGPPGSGKTSVIAKFVELALSHDTPGIWLVAQSNVAVKNIAEKLASIGFMNWKVLVSQDFYNGWHEHLYDESFANNLINSAGFLQFSPNKLVGCKVILCTLSMLSNRYIPLKFTSRIPIHTLVVDEASQIEIGNYLSVLSSAAKTLKKMCFIGDDKQLPPHGQEDLGDLKSVFELEHLSDHLYLLDTQYRMPPQMGDFISEAIYNSELKSNPKHPITDNHIACQFMDVAGTETKSGTSWTNSAEAEAVLKLAQHLQNSSKSYRIVTPYDSQRNLIENRMKEENLDWADKCFNVDSFQGNEDDFIIISLVRSHSIGFLSNLRRTNVMLTRFRRGMYIITSRQFVYDAKRGGDSLVGQLVKYLEEKVKEGVIGNENNGAENVWLSLEEVDRLVLR